MEMGIIQDTLFWIVGILVFLYVAREVYYTFKKPKKIRKIEL